MKNAHEYMTALLALRIKVTTELEKISISGKYIENILQACDEEVVPTFELESYKRPEILRIQVDLSLWSKVFVDLGVYAAMSEEEIRSLNNWIYCHTPEFNKENLEKVHDWLQVYSFREIELQGIAGAAENNIHFGDLIHNLETIGKH